MIALPLIIGFAISRALFYPALDALEMWPNYFDLTEKRAVESARKIYMEEIRMKMNMNIGKVPVLNEMELLVHLHK